MLYTGSFKDINDNYFYTVNIVTPEEGESEELIFGSSPVTISTASEGLFTPIKSRNASIEIATKKYHFNLYNPTLREVQVTIYKEDELIFKGFLLPNSYNQTYTYLDIVTLEAVDALSTTKDYEWGKQWNNITQFLDAESLSQMILTGQPVTTPSLVDSSTATAAQQLTNMVLTGQPDGTPIESLIDYITFRDVFLSILYSCGYRGSLYIPNTYDKINGESLSDLNINNVVEALYCASSNFYDDDAAHTPWNLYSVMSEILQFLGWSMTPDGDDVWIVDYRAVNEKEDLSYSEYSLETLQFVQNSTITNTPLQLADIKAPGTPSLSIDDIYNKIEINDNLYEITELAPDMFDDSNHISVTNELNLDENEHQWTKDNYKKFLWWKYDQSKEITGYTYQTICRLNENKTGFKHYFYKHNSLADVLNDNTSGEYEDKDYYDPSSESEYTNSGINKYCNTHGCLLQHYAYRPEEGTNNLPSTLDWTDILTFFVVNDKTPTMTMADIPKLERKVLTYDVDEEINFKPASGTSWLTISGDLFYQYNGVHYEIDKKNQVLDIINFGSVEHPEFKWYATCPVDKAVTELTDQRYCSFYRDYASSHDTNYNTGFGMWKMRVEINGKYWKDEYNPTTHTYDSGWVDTPTDFYIRYNNNPAKPEDEYIPAFEWMSIANNSNYKNKVGVDGYCIPIAADDENAPSFGKLHITIYTPTLLPVEVREWFIQHSVNQLNWGDVPPCIFAKDFEIGYVYTDSTVWYQQHSQENVSDNLYVANINADNVNEFGGLEFKLNTMTKDKPISRSYVTTEDGYLQSLEHHYGLPYTVDGEIYKEKTQEWNICDAYILHHSERRPIFEFNVHDYYKPYQIFNYGRWMTEQNELGLTVPFDFVIDEQRYDLLKNHNTIKFISF